MSTTPREIGTLIVVVLKANHLPNKRNIGKQDPYCVVSFNGEERRTKAIKRGGQHPEWDEEIRFTLFEDIPDRLPSANGAPPPPPPPKHETGPPKVKGGKSMKLVCYAEDKEPDLIGECVVDLTEVLTKGETDEWFTLMHKDKFCGKVYLELTFYANAPAPAKKVTPKPLKNKQYAGPGSFVPLGEPHFDGAHPGRTASAGGSYDHGRNASDPIPASLRASNALAKLDLYVPPYEQRNRLSGMDQLTHDFNEFGVTDHGRRAETLPPRTPITPRPVTPSYSHGDPYNSYYVDHPGQTYDNQYLGPSNHHMSYGNGQNGRPSTIKAPRHSIPTTSSGFMPLNSASTFGSMPQHHVTEPSGPIYDPNPYTAPTPHPSHTPAPTVLHSHTSSGSGSYLPQHSFSAPPTLQYNQYASQPPAPQTPAPHLQIPGQAPPIYPSRSYTPAPLIDTSYGHTIQQASPSLQSNAANSSRPLPPQPQVVYAQQPIVSYTPAPPVPQVYPPSSFLTQPVAPMQTINNNFQALPAPPPPPANVDYNSQRAPQPQSHRQSSLPTPPGDIHSKLPTPPPPPPLQTTVNNISPTSQRRSSGFPQPPILYQQPQLPMQQNAYSIPYPPPPPPPLPEEEYLTHAPLPPPPPPSGLPANPPTSSFPQAPWLAPGHTQYTQASYI